MVFPIKPPRAARQKGMDGQTDRWTDRRRDEQTERQSDIKKKTDGQTEKVGYSALRRINSVVLSHKVPLKR